MTSLQASLLTADMPRAWFYLWTAIIVAMCYASHRGVHRRYRRFVKETEAKLADLEQRADASEAKIDAELASMRAELDAYGAWSDASGRFFHHGLVSVSHLLGARALPPRRACASERRRTSELRSSATAWRPKPKRGASPLTRTGGALQVQRRTCP